MPGAGNMPGAGMVAISIELCGLSRREALNVPDFPSEARRGKNRIGSLGAFFSAYRC